MVDDIVDRIRRSYDVLASEYVRRIADELRHKPLDRELLDRFARRTIGQGSVCDLGCGPGHVTRYLRDRHVEMFALDVSPAMLEEARKLNPDIAFREGDMLGLDVESGSLAGIVSFYAIVNLPKHSVPLAFREMARVLRANAPLLLAFHIGHETMAIDELWGQRIEMDFVLFDPSEICSELEAVGIAIEEVVKREPYPEVEYPSRRAYVFAHNKG